MTQTDPSGEGIDLGSGSMTNQPSRDFIEGGFDSGADNKHFGNYGQLFKGSVSCPSGDLKQNKTKPRKISAPSGEHNFNPSTTRKQRQKYP